jgi:replicative DNA helicase
MSTPELQTFLAFAQEIMRRVYAEEDQLQIHQWATEQLARLGGTVDNDAVMTWLESFDFYDELLAKRAADALLPPEDRKTIDWMWESWNRMLDPLEPGMLAVLSAGDGQGKTIYAECLAEHWARRKNHVVFVHYELNRALMLDRRAARHTGITRRELKSGKLTREQAKMVADMRPKLTAWDGHITYLHTPGWSMEKTVQELRRLKAEGQCDVVMLDYLEKNAPSRRQLQMFGNNSYQREADNVEQLKNFAEATETPVLMLAQMSKAGKSAAPELMDRTDMRGAGEKSEKANVVILLKREKIEGGYSNEVNVVVDKNTIGATGAFKQLMEPELFRVHDLDTTRIELNK